MLKMIKLVLKCLCMSMLKPSLINAREIESDIHELRDGMGFKMLTCNVVCCSDVFSAFTVFGERRPKDKICLSQEYEIDPLSDCGSKFSVKKTASSFSSQVCRQRRTSKLYVICRDDFLESILMIIEYLQDG